MAAHDVVFFEWAGRCSSPPATSDRTPIVVRLHSFELFACAPRVNWDAACVVLVEPRTERRFCDLFPAQAEKTRGTRPRGTVRPSAFTMSGGAAGRSAIRLSGVYELILSVHQLAQSGARVSLRIGGPEVKAPRARDTTWRFSV